MVDRDKRYIDPMFYLPPGIDDDVWQYKEDRQNPIGWDDATVEAEGYGDVYEDVDSDDTIFDEGDSSNDDAPAAVEELVVVQQILRRTEDGGAVIDLIVDVDDIPGITHYQFRVTKV